MAQKKAIAKRLLKKKRITPSNAFFSARNEAHPIEWKNPAIERLPGPRYGGGDILNFGIFVLRPGVVDWRRARDARFQARTAASVGRGRSADVGAPADAGRILAVTSRGCPFLFFFFFCLFVCHHPSRKVDFLIIDQPVCEPYWWIVECQWASRRTNKNKKILIKY